MGKSSRLPGFYKLPVEERLRLVKEFADLTDEEIALLKNTGALPLSDAARMIENVVGAFQLPVGIVTNMLINGKDVLVPMAVEETSVVAAASHAAKLAREKGGFTTTSTGPLMMSQIQAVNVSDPFGAKALLYERKDELLRIANEQDPVLVRLGGGARDVEVRVVDTPRGAMVVTHLIVDTKDAMGANTVNTMAERVAPYIERWTGGRVYLRIVTNLADRRLVRARTVVAKEALGGADVVDGILAAQALAENDPYRAATHNKGILNGITPIVLVTGNDTRAVEAGAHAYAARTGSYRPLTSWERNSDGDLVGTIEVPVAVGLVGGVTKLHPISRIAIKILGVKTASELAEIIGAVGLAQNLAALYALVTTGVQKGHMSLHAQNIAMMAGAIGDQIDQVADELVRRGVIRVDVAEEILKQLTQR